ncbi:MAG: EpsG family protein [Paludibacteraceae bacterium]|nr:EpsG family protein [Paludibacteraceae bacterium]
MVYFVFIVLALFFSLIFDREKGYHGAKCIAYVAMCGFLVLIAGLRDGLGGDTFFYQRNYEYWYEGAMENDLLSTLGWELKHSGYMPLWSLVNIWVRQYSASFVVFQLLHALVVNGVICWVISRHSDRGFMFLLFYLLVGTFFLFNTEVMREGLAIAMALVGIECFTTGRKWLFWVFVVLAVGFHISALVLLLYPFVRIGMSWATIGWATLAAFGVWVVSDMLLTVAVSHSGALPEFLSFRLEGYAAFATNFNGFLRFLLHFLLVPSVLILYSMHGVDEEKECEWRERMVAFFLPLGIVAAAVPGFTRFTNYVMVFELMALAEVSRMLFEEQRHLLVRGGAVVAFVLLYTWSLLTYYPQNDFYMYEFYAPYTSVFNKDEVEKNRREMAHLESCSNDWGDAGARNIEQ